jgi:opacity protein-like surface antigen
MTRILLTLTIMLVPALALAQTPALAAAEPRYVVEGGAGFGTTWDDEGLLGRGLGVSGGAGIRLTPRLTVLGFVDRIAYYRDVEWLTFDGRVVFAGAEANMRFRRAGMSPYVTVGAGMLNDSGVWIQKNQAGPSAPRTAERIDRNGTAATMTASGGVEIPVSEHTSIRGALRFYGLLDTGEDLFPHTILQPIVGIVFRF